MKATRLLVAATGVLLPLLLLSTTVARAVVTIEPGLEQQLRDRGVYDQVTAQLRAARDRGLFDVPLPEEGLGKEVAKARTWRAIVLLVDFSDAPATGLYNQDEFEELLFSESMHPTGSMRDFYLENSGGDFSLVGDIVGWLRMPQPLSYYANNDGVAGTGDDFGFGAYPNNARKLYEDAITAADPVVNFAQYTNSHAKVRGVFLVHSGKGAETTGNPNDIWSHQSSADFVTADGVQTATYIFMPERQGTGMSTVGVFCHEFGHVLGLPDLYDIDGSSSGIGRWGLMGSGSWNGGGTRPAHCTGWTKQELGFLTPTDMSTNVEGVVLAPAAPGGAVLRLRTGDMGPQEYFLVENRQWAGFDDALPGEGLVIYHVDDARNSNAAESCEAPASEHPIVRVVQADGLCELEQKLSSGDADDPFPGAMNVTSIGATTLPSTRAYAGNKSGVRLSAITVQGDDVVFDLQLDETILARVPLDVPTLQDALALTGSGDEVRLPAGHTEIGNFSALGGVHISGGWDPAYTTQDPTAPSVVQGGNASKPVLRAQAGSQPLKLDNLVISGGKGDIIYLPEEQWRGGAIQAQGVSMEIRRTRFEGNRAGPNDNRPSVGGALALESCDVLVEDSSFGGNLAKEGGEIWVRGGSLTLRRTDFEGGDLYVPVVGTEQRGGALLAVDTDVVIEDCDFVGYGGADKGGAIHASGAASLQLSRVAIDSCTADQSGGGLWLQLSEAVLRDVDLWANQAGSEGAGAKVSGGLLDWGGGTLAQNTGALLGGGLQVAGAAAGSRLEGLAVVGNQALAVGGGVMVTGGALDLAHVTLAANQGGGMVVSAATTQLVNSIVAHNPGVGVTYSSATITALDHNVWFDNGGGDLSGGAKGSADLDLDPLFVGAGDYHLGAGSPAIDSGDPQEANDFDGSPPDRGAWGGAFDRGQRPRALAASSLDEPTAGDFLLQWQTGDDSTPATTAATVDIYGQAGTAKTALGDLPWLHTAPAADGQWLHPSGLADAVVSYQLQPVDASGRAGAATPLLTNDATAAPPRAARFAVGDPFPNPFNPTTHVELHLPRAGRVRASVHDMAGRHVTDLVDAELGAGVHRLSWQGRDHDGRGVASGVYLLRIRTEAGEVSRRLVLVK